jgi:hypothetical protein
MSQGIYTITTNDKDFNIFKEEARFWIDVFGLSSWDVDFAHIDEDEGYSASCMYWSTARYAVLNLAQTMVTKNVRLAEDRENEIRRFAFHEVVELLLSEVDDIMKSRTGITSENIETASHRVIKTLENVIFNKCKGFLSHELQSRSTRVPKKVTKRRTRNGQQQNT